jgi:hypothetical protein
MTIVPLALLLSMLLTSRCAAAEKVTSPRLSETLRRASGRCREGLRVAVPEAAILAMLS